MTGIVTGAAGTVTGAALLAESAIATQREDPANWSEGFLDAKQTSARFFIEQLLPMATALLPSITAGGDVLFEISPENF